MSKATHGDAAFPRQAALHPDSGRVLFDGQDGMSLRDYFAAKAMQGWITGVEAVDIENAAKRSYDIADALLKVRRGE